MKSSRTLSILAAACTLACAAHRLSAQVAIDGTLDAAYGSPLTTQTINTGFGDSTVGDGTSGGGSELDAAYATVTNGVLDLMITGNLESNGNHINIFIDDGRAGENTLQPISSGAIGSNMAGSVFSTGFNATVALDFSDANGNLYLDNYNFIQQTHGYPGYIPITAGLASSPSFGGVAIGYNDTNAAGVNGVTGTAVTDPDVPNAVTTGLEVGIPLAVLGSPSNTSIKVMIDVNGGGDSYLSNQFLPGLPVATGNLGGGGPYSGTQSGAFNFSSLSSEYFTVAIPNISGTWTNATGDSNWSDSGNWSGGVVPHVAGDSANFTNSAGGTVNVDGSFTVGTLDFNAPANTYVLSANALSDVITLQNTSGDASITDYAGNHQIYGDLYLASNTDITINNSNDSLAIIGTISGPGSLSSKNPGDGQLSYLYLYGPNTYTGGTIINSGTVQLDGLNALPPDTALTMNASDVPDPTLDLNGNNISISSFTLITGPQTTQVGAYAIIESTSGTSATITYDGSNSNPSTFNGDIANYGQGTISLVINTGTFISASNNSMTGPITVNSGATLTLANPSGSSFPNSAITNNGTLNINDGEVIFPGYLNNNGTVNINAGGVYQLKPGIGSFTLPAGINLTGGKIDTTDDSFVIPFTAGNDPIATIQAEIKSAFDAGAWDGPGIMSSDIATTPGTALGYADGNTDDTSAAPNTILVKLAWLGDLDLDGSVTSADLATLRANLGKTSNVDWAMGDLNYDGVINGDDLSLYMLGNALSGGAPLTVPEPTALAVICLPLLALRRRRMA